MLLDLGSMTDVRTNLNHSQNHQYGLPNPLFNLTSCETVDAKCNDIASKTLKCVVTGNVEHVLATWPCLTQEYLLLQRSVKHWNDVPTIHLMCCVRCEIVS